MNTTAKIIALTALTGLSAAGFSGAAAAASADVEKCYGIVKAGKNDCATANSSCAGTSTKDSQSDSFIAVPKGLCDRLSGGSLTSS